MRNNTSIKIKRPKTTGRPSLGEKKKSKPHMVRFDEEQDERLIFRAELAGMTVTEYIREATLNAKISPRLSPDEQEYIRQILKIGVNFNQLLKLAHTVGLVSMASKIESIIGQLSRLLNKIKF